MDEIEAEADRCRSFAQIGHSDRIDVDELLKVLNIRLCVKSDAEMGDDIAYSDAVNGQIFCRRRVSRGLRFGDPWARYLVGHELGHIILQPGGALKARKSYGNKTLAFIDEDESGERQAWKFARALFVTRCDLTSGESDEDIAIRVGIPPGPVRLRREEVRKAMQAHLPKVVPPFVSDYLESARSAEKAGREKRAAWERAAVIEGEVPARARCARGYRVEWSHYERANSQVGWVIVRGEVRSLMELLSR